MTVRRHRSALVIVAFAALVLAAPAAGAPILPTGSTRYVRIVHLGGGKLSIALTPRGRRQFNRVLRGYILDATCTTLGSSVQGFSQRSESGQAESGSQPGGRFTYHVLLDRHADFCDVGRARQRITRNGVSTTSVPGPRLDSIALTQRGAAYLDEDRVTQRVFAVLTTALGLALQDPSGHFPSAQTLVTQLRGQVVALASPDASPPPGVVGFYSDGASHAQAAALSALGRRIFFDSNSGVLSTNAAEHLFRAVTATPTGL